MIHTFHSYSRSLGSQSHKWLHIALNAWLTIRRAVSDGVGMKVNHFVQANPIFSNYTLEKSSLSQPTLPRPCPRVLPSAPPPAALANMAASNRGQQSYVPLFLPPAGVTPPDCKRSRSLRPFRLRFCLRLLPLHSVCPRPPPSPRVPQFYPPSANPRRSSSHLASRPPCPPPPSRLPAPPAAPPPPPPPSSPTQGCAA